MNVLSIGTDRNIFNENSGAFSRMLEYSKMIDGLFIIIFSNKKNNFKFKKIGNLNIYPVNYSFKLLSFFNLYFLFKKIIKDNRLNNKNCIITSQDPFEVGFFSCVLKNIFKFKLQVQVHNDFLNPYYKKQSWRNYWQIFLAKNVLKKANQIRTVSLISKNSIIKKFKINKNKIINLPILFFPKNIENFDNKNYLKNKYPQFKLFILMVSRLVKEKNIELAIKAFSNIAINFSDIALIVVGSGVEEEKLKKMSRNNKNIIFEGWSNNLSNYYNSADIFLFTSNHEGWGMVILEAASFSLPIIMTNVGCAGEFIINDFNGLICPVNDLNSIAQNLQYLLKNNEKRFELGFNAKKSYEVLREKNYLEELKKTWENCLNS